MKLYHFTLCFLILAVTLISLYEVGYGEEEEVRRSKQRIDRALDRAVSRVAEDLADLGDLGSQGKPEIQGGYGREAEEALGGYDGEAAETLDGYGREAAETLDGYDGGAAESLILEGVLDRLAEGFLTGLGQDCDNEALKEMKTKLAVAAVSLPGRLYLRSGLRPGSWDMVELDETVDVGRVLEDQLNRLLSQAEELDLYHGSRFEAQIPEASTAMEGRAVTDYSLFVLLCDYPIEGTDRRYERFASSQAGLGYREVYLVDDRGKYHHKACSGLGTELGVYMSSRECAIAGAYPCEICN